MARRFSVYGSMRQLPPCSTPESHLYPSSSFTLFNPHEGFLFNMKNCISNSVSF